MHVYHVFPVILNSILFFNDVYGNFKYSILLESKMYVHAHIVKHLSII